MNGKSIKGSQTEKNLLKSFAGESQARNRYTFFASKAKKEGYFLISQIFEETAMQEKEHAKRFFNQLEGGDLEIQAAFPAGKVGTTAENLLAAANGEKEEWTTLYPEFARVAREEGFVSAAIIWEKISVAEKYHDKRYRGLLKELEAGELFKSPGKMTQLWRCLNCGFIFEGEEAPKQCPACAHPQAYFEKLKIDW